MFEVSSPEGQGSFLLGYHTLPTLFVALLQCIPDDRLPGRRCRRCSDRKLHCVYISISEESSSPRISPSEDQVLQPGSESTTPTVPMNTPLLAFNSSSPSLGEGLNATTPYHITSLPLDSSPDLVIYTDYGGNTYPPVERSFPQQNRSTHGARANPLSSQAADPWFGQVPLYSPYQTPAAFQFNSDSEAAGDMIYHRDSVHNSNYTVQDNIPSLGTRLVRFLP